MKQILKLLGLLFMFDNFRSAMASSIFPVAKTSKEVLNILEKIPQNSIIFVDVDDTIFTPVSKTFRRAPHNRLIDDIKDNKNKYKNYEEIVSNWRLQRKIMLTDSYWPLALAELKKKYRVYALTKMDIGKFGNIESMEKWRYSELESLGIEFSYNDLIPQEPINNASFYKGIFITGLNSKSQTILHYLQYLKADTLVMIDDKKEHLKDIKQFCKKIGVKFVGIIFNGLENFEDIPNADIFSIQKKHLIEHAKWLEDEEAELKLQ